MVLLVPYFSKTTFVMNLLQQCNILLKQNICYELITVM